MTLNEFKNYTGRANYDNDTMVTSSESLTKNDEIRFVV